MNQDYDDARIRDCMACVSEPKDTIEKGVGPSEDCLGDISMTRKVEQREVAFVTWAARTRPAQHPP